MLRNFTPVLLLLIFILSSCSSKIGYIGQSYTATDKIDVYISDRAISQPFQYMGKGYLVKQPYALTTSYGKIQRMAESLGKKKGADAVLITDYHIPNTGGATITTVNRTDSIGNGIVQTGTAVVQPSSASGFNILFIKYSK